MPVRKTRLRTRSARHSEPWIGSGGEASLETCFYRILVRRTRYLMRRQKLRDHWGRLLRHHSPGASSPAPADPDVRARIGRAISGLSHQQREVFVLMHLEGFTAARTAKLLERSEGTVTSHLHRALKALRHELHDLNPAQQKR